MVSRGFQIETAVFKCVCVCELKKFEFVSQFYPHTTRWQCMALPITSEEKMCGYKKQDNENTHLYRTLKKREY